MEKYQDLRLMNPSVTYNAVVMIVRSVVGKHQEALNLFMEQLSKYLKVKIDIKIHFI